MTSEHVVLENVSRFYGDVLGVNRVNLSIPPGITSLVGPNGSGKTTLMNLVTGLVRSTRGVVRVLGMSPERPEELFHKVGYCTQFDSFPNGLSGHDFLYYFLRIGGKGHNEADRRAWEALELVNMTYAAHRKVAAYSRGMRQRVKLAQAVCHDPQVLVLDEPLNGLDPLARAETIALFRKWGEQGRSVIVSSHILHEVDRISDRVVLLNSGYVVAEGQIQGVRSEVKGQPMQVFIRCDQPGRLAARLFQQDHMVEARVHSDGQGLMVRTRDPDQLYLLLNRVVVEFGLEIESVAPADEDVLSVYQYLIGGGGGTS